MQRKQLV